MTRDLERRLGLYLAEVAEHRNIAYVKPVQLVEKERPSRRASR